MSAKCLRLVSALVMLQAAAPVQPLRCTRDATGDLVGNAVELDSRELQPAGNRMYIYEISPLMGCSLNGVSARVCDMYSPDVDVEANLTQVTVRRLGPRSQPIAVEVTLYCDPPILVE